MTTTNFQTYEVPAPNFDDVAAQFADITAALEAAASGDDAYAAVERWDQLRRELGTWNELTQIRFSQDTRNDDYRRAREYRDELEPRLTGLNVDFKRRLLASPHRQALTARLGQQAFDLWECDVVAFEPLIEGDLTEESKLKADYDALIASAKFDFRGETLTLSEITKYEDHADRTVRHEAAQLRWGWFDDNRDQLDAIYDALVKLRHGMATKLGYKNYVELAYKLMHRIDYGQCDVEHFRAQIRDYVVPLVADIRRRQAELLGIDPLMAWDETIYDPAGNPKPLGNDDWVVDRATDMFNAIGHRLDELFAELRVRNLLDLKSRAGKRSGGYCNPVPNFGYPFIFSNFNGTMFDVLVLTHEMGHAFQCHMSLDKPLEDFLFPTMEACEIHSMGLEFLTWPQMEFFFGNEADRFRRTHLQQRIAILTYIAAVDEFQHLIYANPHASPDDRAAMWGELEHRYQPWLNWGDLAHPASGRRWQAQIHVYDYPFYYIDYALALICALQLWQNAERDREATMRDYVNLCRRGGEAPFQQLAASAGLTSPFDDDCVERVVAQVRKELGHE